MTAPNNHSGCIPLATDRKGGALITADFSRSRAAFICGKRGGGKSYTLGRLIEQIHHVGDQLIVVVDPLSIFWTTAIPLPNSNLQTQTSASPSDSPLGAGGKGFPVRLILPGGADRLGPLAEPMRALGARGIEIVRLRVNPCHLSAEAWVMLFNAKITDPQGILLFRTVTDIQKRTPDRWQLSDLRTAVEADELAADSTKAAIMNRLSIAESWDIFDSSSDSPSDSPLGGTSLREAGGDSDLLNVFQPGKINVIDVSIFDPGRNGLRNLIVKLVCDRLFIARVAARRAELIASLPAQNLQSPISGDTNPQTHQPSNLSTVPRVFLFIDEAHDFCPAVGESLAKSSLIRWAKEGRQPGLSLAIATQQPAACDFDLISQCDLFVIHHITLADDVRTVARLSTSYAVDVPAFLKGVRQPGEAIIVDDIAEKLAIGHILPREAIHGGAEALPKLTANS